MQTEMKLISLLVVCGAGLCLGGCPGMMQADIGDRMTFTGTPKAIQAYADYQNGMIRTVQEQGKKPSTYFAHRATQETEATARKAQAIGFWQRAVSAFNN